MAGRIDGRVPGLLDLDWERHLSDPGGDTSALSFLSGLGLGTLVGVLVALLLAPQPGRQIREQVRHTGIELRSRAPHRAPRSSATSPDLPTSETLADEAEHAEVELMRRMAQGDDGPAE
jgi:gas vesicle protein